MFENRKFTGVGLSEGETVAPICLYAPENHLKVRERALVDDSEVDGEMARLEKTVQIAAADLDKWADEVTEKIGKAESGIFLAQKYILLDNTVLTMVRNDIRKRRRNAEAAIDEVYKAYEESFLSMENSYLRERSKDIADIRKRLLDILHDTNDGFKCEGRHQCARGAGKIIVAEELTPQMIAKTDFSTVKGFVSAKGSRTSHAAIIARALGLPAVSAIEGIFDKINCGDIVYVNGTLGTIIINPDKALRLSVSQKHIDSGFCLVPSLTGVETMANASLPEEIDVIKSVCADGIGLFRTEFLFIRAGRALTENEQLDIYSSIVKKMDGKPVTFRLLDVGGDKPLPFMEFRKEDNPYLGFRGARFLLGHKELLVTQIRALARASVFGEVRILIPMVTDLHQWRKLASIAEEEIASVEHVKENVKIGPMFEVPSVCYDAEVILSEADFASIGTNDLIQYLFAVDRNNEHVAADYNPDHPVLWKVLKMLADAGKKSSKKISACGELASIPLLAKRLVEAGITSLSMSPRFIPVIREALSEKK
ncbi:MAG: phosphoenolpyruvate--protein phosphotransferase [Fibrobacteres bacterium]|nr:phosphoenolpyruvate--protein phosphotransferase [Fibrobacterota bacterium]